MHSSDYERFVEAYLLNSRQVLVAPQFLIRVNGKDRWIDILAADLAKRLFYLVEITENRNPKGLTEKVHELHLSAEWLAKRLEHEFEATDKWTTRPWLFVRKDSINAYLAALKSKGMTLDCDFVITELEHVIARPDHQSKSYKLADHWGPLAKKMSQAP